jgi:hypothetical protein
LLAESYPLFPTVAREAYELADAMLAARPLSPPVVAAVVEEPK